MMKISKTIAIPALFALAACGSSQDGSSAPPDRDEAETDAGAEGQLDRPGLTDGELTIEGRIAAGVECPIIRTPDGDTYAIAMGEADFGPGDYVRITGDLAEMSICQQGRGTIEPARIDSIEPPARDRDPARAGSVKLTEEYVTGSWVAKGVDADCDYPDFRIVASPAVVVLKGTISNHDDSARVALDNYPRIDLDEPRDDLPIESRGPDGLAILRPATDAEYDPIEIGSATITGDGVVFVKCSN